MSDESAVWVWAVHDGAGRPVGEPPPSSATRFDAETWLGRNWRRLAASGAILATLRRDGEPVSEVALREFEF